MPGSQASLFSACAVAFLLLIPHGDAAPSLERCSDLLEFGALYYPDLDAADQRTALMQLYNSTGGNTWTQQLINSQQRQSFRQLVTELEEAGHGLANSSLTIASPFPTDLVTDLFNLPALSINCELQQWLSFGQLLLKFEWGSNVSYCQWYGVVCCKTSGDLLNQYCSGPQSVAAVVLPGMNLTGSIPTTFFTSMVDLQTLILDKNPELVGSVPNLGGQICSKMTSLSLQNTGLMQCNATHLSALHRNATGPQLDCCMPTSFPNAVGVITLPVQVVNAGRSSNMAADNMAGCLPDVWQFCEPRPVPHHANLMCPSVAYRRPVVMMTNKLVQLQTFLGIINVTQNLTLAMLNVTANSPALVGPRVTGTADSRERPGSPSRSAGPGGGAPGLRGPPPHFEAVGCSADGFRTTGQLKKQGFSATVSVMGYDEGLFSFVGCRCNAGYDNVYTISKTGRVSMLCVQEGNMSRLLAKQILVGIVVCGLILGLILLLVCRGRQIMTELLKARLNRIKRGHAPGTLQAELAEEMGLIPKEITLVMTDVQASSKLWEWNSRVMHEALDMHDACLRAVLHQHHGYEVATEGDAFTMAFHDPIDALSWALEVQHKLLLLPWPPQLLTQTDAQEECTPESLSLPKQALLLKGLRVRMAIHTGLPDALQVHHVTRQVEYRGDVVSLTEALMDFPAGGQVLLSGSTYQRMYGRLHTLKFDDRVPKQSSRSHTAREAGVTAADNSKLHPRYESRYIAILDSQPSSPSSFDLAMEGSQADMFLDTSSQAALSPTSPSGHSQGLPQSSFGQQRRRGPAAKKGVLRRVLSGAAGLARQLMGWGRHVGRRLMFFGGRQQDTQLQPERSFFRKWRPSQTDVSGMVNSTALQKGVTPCVLADGGAFHLAEFARTLCTPFVGSAVHGGIHILHIQSTKLAPRMLLFPPLKSTFKVAPAFRDAPGVSQDGGRSFRLKPQPKDTWLVFHPPKQATAQTDLREVSMVFCGPAQYKELLQRDPAAARSALRHFQSCVRTTLLLSHGYECQEKDGLFMIAFSEPRGAVEWAVLLQLALLKAPWSPALEQYESTAEVLSSTGQTLFKGFAAKVGIVHGEMTKICPHTSTGRADYFGSVVNRAARLLCAAAAGQTLIEAQLMDEVLRQWGGDAYNLAPIPTAGSSNTGFGGIALPTLGAALLASGALPLPETAGPLAAEQNMTPRIKSAPQLSAQELLIDPSSSSVVAEAEVQPTTAEVDSRGYPLTLSEAGRSVSGGMKGWGPWAPHTNMRSSLSIGNSKLSKQAVSFAPSGPGAIRREGRSAITAFSPGRSTDGVSYTDDETQQLGVTDSCCAPFAAGDPLAVSNCHMLKFLAASGVTVEGRLEAVVVPQRRPRKFGKSSSVSAKRSPRPSQDPQPNMSGCSGSSSVGNGGSRLNSLKPDMKASGLAPRIKEGSNNRPVWTPTASQGQPFPVKRVLVQVWGIGAFKFKNIQGISKVMEVQPADLAERMELQSRTLEPGKATCVLSAQYLRCCLNIQLMDVLDLQLSL